MNRYMSVNKFGHYMGSEETLTMDDVKGYVNYIMENHKTEVISEIFTILKNPTETSMATWLWSEILEKFEQLLKEKLFVDGKLNVNNSRITNVADGVQITDAVTKRQLINYFNKITNHLSGRASADDIGDKELIKNLNHLKQLIKK